MIVLAATNFPDVLDPALTRPGRFDKQVEVPRPDVRGRKMVRARVLPPQPFTLGTYPVARCMSACLSPVSLCRSWSTTSRRSSSRPT